MKLNKRFGLALTAILCAIAICAAMIPAMSIFADEVNWEEATPIEGITATVTDPFHVPNFWHIDYLFDGAWVEEGMGWHASADGSNIPSEETPTVISADLNGYYDVSIIFIYPMNHTGVYQGTPSMMPSAFTLELSTDNGETWIEVIAESEVYCTMDDEPLIYFLPDMDVGPVMGATDFRMTITAPADNDMQSNGIPCTGIGDIEIYGFVAEAPETTAPETVTETVVETVVESEEIESEEIESEEIESEEIESEEIESEEIESEEIESEEIESEVESENEEIESEVESAEETVVETTVETKGETTVETKGETTAETKGETKAPETEAPAADEGCASVVGFGAVAVLTAAAAAVVLKKKD